MVHNPIDSKAFEPDATIGTAMKLVAPSVEICRVINPPEKCIVRRRERLQSGFDEELLILAMFLQFYLSLS